MTEEVVAKSSTLRFTPYIPWVSAYAVAAGALYLWGYWSKFHVNILEYMGLLELALAAAFPLFSAVIGLVGGVVLGQVFGGNSLSQGHGAGTKFGRTLKRYARLLLFLYLALVIVGSSLIGTPDAGAFVVPLALSPLIAFAITQTDFLSDGACLKFCVRGIS
ncbi:hypothetical protein [Povalibacter sp.]|uniref:hypothetical protein n=1 Tax=Povalibacter sp. TaxID=1962978 RepID=UPI002F3E8FBD